MSRAITKNELKRIFLESVAGSARYWATTNGTEKEKLDGLAFSIMSIIDGNAGDIPCSFDIIARPHPDDKQYHIDNGDNYVEDGMCINEDTLLHEEIIKYE